MFMNCTKCFTADDVTYIHAPEGGYLYTCTNTGKHDGAGVWVWPYDPAPSKAGKTAQAGQAGQAGKGEGQAKTDDLIEPLTTILAALPTGVFHEHGILEYELRLQYPELFGRHVAENGHVLLEPAQGTASGTRFAAAMMRLERTGSATHVRRPATGAWAYNSGVSYWALTPTPGLGGPPRTPGGRRAPAPPPAPGRHRARPRPAVD
jgi:hypothetical protein